VNSIHCSQVSLLAQYIVYGNRYVPTFRKYVLPTSAWWPSEVYVLHADVIQTRKWVHYIYIYIYTHTHTDTRLSWKPKNVGCINSLNLLHIQKTKTGALKKSCFLLSVLHFVFIIACCLFWRDNDVRATHHITSHHITSHHMHCQCLLEVNHIIKKEMSLCYGKKESFVLYHERPAVWRIYLTISVVPFTSRSLHFTSSSLGNCAISCFLSSPFSWATHKTVPPTYS
jgi:hypothetical protein